jgi:hypothetical protein
MFPKRILFLLASQTKQDEGRVLIEILSIIQPRRTTSSLVYALLLGVMVAVS